MPRTQGKHPNNSRFTLADPMPRLCPDAVDSANVNRRPTRNRLSGPHREGHRAIGPDWFGRSGGFSQRNDAWQPISTNHSDYGYFEGCFKYVGYLKMCHLTRGPAFMFMFSCSL